MKAHPLVIVLLALSVAGNVALGVRALLARPAAPGASRTEATPSTPTVRLDSRQSAVAAVFAPPHAAVESTPVLWSRASASGDLSALAAGLRAAGFPPGAVRAVVIQQVDARLADRNPDAGTPHWRRDITTPELIAARQEHAAERRALLESALGPDARPSALLDPVSRAHRYGNLPDDKVDRLEQIERDYLEIQTGAGAGREPGLFGGDWVLGEEAEAIKADRRADLSEVLTPEELEAYEMRTSENAEVLRRELSKVQVDEEQFAALYRLKESRSAEGRGIDNRTAEGARRLAEIAERKNEEARKILTDDGYYEFLKKFDRGYGTAASFAERHPSMTPKTTHELSRLQRQFHVLAAQANPSKGRPSPRPIGELRAEAAKLNARLDELLGPDIAAGYRQTNDGKKLIEFIRAK